MVIIVLYSPEEVQQILIEGGVISADSDNRDLLAAKFLGGAINLGLDLRKIKDWLNKPEKEDEINEFWNLAYKNNIFSGDKICVTDAEEGITLVEFAIYLNCLLGYLEARVPDEIEGAGVF